MKHITRTSYVPSANAIALTVGLNERQTYRRVDRSGDGDGRPHPKLLVTSASIEPRHAHNTRGLSTLNLTFSTITHHVYF